MSAYPKTKEQRLQDIESLKAEKTEKEKKKEELEREVLNCEQDTLKEENYNLDTEIELFEGKLKNLKAKHPAVVAKGVELDNMLHDQKLCPRCEWRREEKAAAAAAEEELWAMFRNLWNEAAAEAAAEEEEEEEEGEWVE